MIMSMIIMVIIISSTTMVTIVLVFLAILINHQLYTFIQLKIKENNFFFFFNRSWSLFFILPDLTLIFLSVAHPCPICPFCLSSVFLLQSEAIILIFRSDLCSLGKQEMV